MTSSAFVSPRTPSATEGEALTLSSVVTEKELLISELQSRIQSLEQRFEAIRLDKRDRTNLVGELELSLKTVFDKWDAGEAHEDECVHFVFTAAATRGYRSIWKQKTDSGKWTNPRFHHLLRVAERVNSVRPGTVRL